MGINNVDNAYDMVMDGLSFYIQQASKVLGQEESSPMGDPDASDHSIDFNSKKLALLRLLRERFEDCVNGNLRLDKKYVELAETRLP